MLSHHNGVFAHSSKTGSVFVSQRLAPTAFSLQSPKTYCFLSQLLYLTLVKISQTQKNVNVIRRLHAKLQTCFFCILYILAFAVFLFLPTDLFGQLQDSLQEPACQKVCKNCCCFLWWQQAKDMPSIYLVWCVLTLLLFFG